MNTPEPDITVAAGEPIEPEDELSLADEEMQCCTSEPEALSLARRALRAEAE